MNEAPGPMSQYPPGINNRATVAIVIGFISSFLIGWLVFGLLFKNKPEEEMIWQAMMLANLCWIFLFVALIRRMGPDGFIKGAATLLCICLLISLFVDLYSLEDGNKVTGSEFVFADLFVTALMNAITGGIIGWMLGMGKSATT